VPQSVAIRSSSVVSAVEAATRWIQPLLGASEILILGATRAAADELARSLPIEGTFGLHRMTLTQLAAALAAARMAEEGLAPATRIGIEAVCARAVHRALKDGELRYFTPVARFPGFPSALAKTVSDLRLAGLRPSALKKSPAVIDIGRLLAFFEDELEKRKLADLSAVLGIATEAARFGSHELLGLPVVMLDVPRPSKAHSDFVNALLERAAGVCVTELSDAHQSGAEAPTELKLALQQVRERLFSPEALTPGEYDESVQLFSAPGESLEAVEIARRIRDLARDGIPFDECAILLRQPDRYQPLIEEALRRAGIPAYFSRGARRPDPAGRAFLALLACASEGCSASRFAEYLSLGQIPPLDSQGVPPRRAVEWTPADDELMPAAAAGAAVAVEREGAPDPTTIATPLAWEKLLVDAAVIGGYERWARRLRGLGEEFRIQLASLRAEEQTERDRIEREQVRLSNLERFALPLIEDLHALPAEAKWGDWIQALGQLAARALFDPDPVTELLAELRPMAEVGPVDLNEVRNVLTERLRFLRREPPHRRYGRVFVASIEEARGRVFDTVFLPGLAEGLFPQKASEDPLLLDDLRRAASEALPSRADRAADERRLLRTAAASARKRFVASYPSMDLAQGRPRVPSFYALEIARAIGGRVPALRPFETRLSENAEARLVWPAPKDPLNAIDNTEYDLAWLAAHRDENSSARYLLDANPHLARSLRTRWKRWEKKWTEADGFVNPDEATRGLLAEQRLDEREYSPTALQNFALCPYRFVLNGILRLGEREDAVAIEQLDPLTRGAIVHEVQREFLRWFKENPATNRDVLLVRLDEVLARVTDSYAERIAPAIPRVWTSEVENIRTDLRGWVSEWLSQSAVWEPLHFELGFGLREDPEHRDAASRREPVHLDGVRVRGSIDLVERHRATGVLRITDHKTGRPLDSAPASISGGKVLQPVLYALAAEKMLNAKAEWGRLWYCTQRGNYTEYNIPIDAKARQRFQTAMQLVDEAIATGFLPAAPAKDACAMCEYRPVCGPNEEVRVRRWKNGEALDRLNELRSLP
jgi:ATP-dependent helicase/DNAse subunit B